MIAPHFPPDSSAAAHRVRLLAPHLPSHGWRPTVLTLAPDAYEGSVDARLGSLVPGSVDVIRCRAWSARWTRRVGFGDLGLRALSSLWRAAEAELAARPCDAVFITVYPVYPSLLGPALKRRFRIPFVLDYQDPWVGSWGATVGGGRDGAVDWRSRASRALGLRLEPLVVRAADAITAVSQATVDDVLARVPRERPVVAELPIGWEPADFTVVNGGRIDWFDPHDGCVHLSYVGTLLPNAMGTLRALLGAAARLRDTEPAMYARLRLHFFGTSNQFAHDEAARVLPVAREMEVVGIVSEHPPRIPYIDALRVLKQSTGILLLGSSEPHYTASKLYPAMSAGRPILALFHQASSSTRILRELTRPPTVRLLSYADAPDAADVLPLLRDVVRQPVFVPENVDLAGARRFAAPALAADLARVLDQVS